MCAAFAGLLQCRAMPGPASADAAAGIPKNDDTGPAAMQPVQRPLLVPPRPSQPVRMPRKSRGLHTPPPSFSGPLMTECSGTFSAASSSSPPSSTSSQLDEVPTCRETADNGLNLTNIASPSQGGVLPQQDRAKLTKNSNRSTLPDCGGYCCFRDGRGSPCEAIREDRPHTVFEMDVAILELRSLLRRHSIEPNEALCNDLVMWQTRAGQRLSTCITEGSRSV
mmetsp:Transcript_89507/g.177929  ORF Transcript_89507/g.177929 Transcript_89507/m.177929 type:complete len:223 (-) Transcript_89507:43-711(-)